MLISLSKKNSKTLNKTKPLPCYRMGFCIFLNNRKHVYASFEELTGLWKVEKGDLTVLFLHFIPWLQCSQSHVTVSVRMMYVTDKQQNTNSKSNINRSAGEKTNYGNKSGLHTDERSKPLKDGFFKYCSNYQHINDQTSGPLAQHVKIIH